MPPPLEPALYTLQGSELPLSGQALVDLMRAVLARGAAFRFRAKGYSMAPFIRDGDVICVAPLSGRPGLGQVVAFIHPRGGQLTVHRIVARREDTCLLRGDAVDQADGVVSLSSILGRVTSVEREGRPIRLGLGIERYAIALLLRHDFVWGLVRQLGSVALRLCRGIAGRVRAGLTRQMSEK